MCGWSGVHPCTDDPREFADVEAGVFGSDDIAAALGGVGPSLLNVVVDTRPEDPPAWCHGGGTPTRGLTPLEPRCTIATVPHGAHVCEGPRP